MKQMLSRPGARPCLIAAAVCFFLAVFFRFALVGYGIMALLFGFVGAVVLLYFFLPRLWRAALTVVLCLGTALFIAAEVPVVRAARGDPETDADYLIVLGAGVNGAVPSLSMVNRLTAALDYLEAHGDCVAVVTGGKGTGEDVTEARAMSDWLTAHGVQGGRILLEERAVNTRENIAFSLELIPDPETASLAVCSSEYHLYRAETIAASMGYTLSGVPARTTLPVLKVNYFIREALGVVHFYIFGE